MLSHSYRHALPVLLLSLVSGVAAVRGSVTLSGTAFRSAPGIDAGDAVVYIADNDPTNAVGFGSLLVLPGGLLSDSSTYGSGFTVLGVKTASSSFGQVMVSGSLVVSYDAFVSEADTVAAVVFSISTVSALAGDSFSLWTHSSWLLPLDGASVTFQATPSLGNLQQIGSSGYGPLITSTVIPEPASTATVSGALVIAVALASRRRRQG